MAHGAAGVSPPVVPTRPALPQSHPKEDVGGRSHKPIRPLDLQPSPERASMPMIDTDAVRHACNFTLPQVFVSE